MRAVCTPLPRHRYRRLPLAARLLFLPQTSPAAHGSRRRAFRWGGEVTEPRVLCCPICGREMGVAAPKPLAWRPGHRLLARKMRAAGVTVKGIARALCTSERAVDGQIWRDQVRGRQWERP